MKQPADRPTPIPGFWLALLVLTTPKRDREALIGDFEEEFRAIEREQGPRAARAWSRRQATGSVIPNLLRSRSTGATTAPARRAPRLEILWRDLRHAARGLSKSPTFTATAVMALALGLGANISIFSLTNAVFFRSAPGVQDSTGLFRLTASRPDGGTSLSHPDFVDLRERVARQADLVAYVGTPINVGTGDPSDRVRGALVSWNYFDVLGLDPAIGRFFTKAEDQAPGAEPVAVITHSFWQGALGGTPDVVGSEIHLNGTVFQIVGVTNPAFRGIDRFDSQQIFAPLMMQQTLRPRAFSFLDRRDALWLSGFGRVREKSDLAIVRGELEAASRDLAAAHPDTNAERRFEAHPGVRLEPGDAAEAAPIAAVLTGFVSLVLLVACANVANLCLARSTERQGEIAIRKALGASRSRILSQLLTESLLLSTLAAGSGLALAWLTRGALQRLVTNLGEIPIAFDGRVLGFAAASTLLTVLLFGAAPSWRASTRHSKGASRGASRTLASGRLRAALVVSQVAFAALLLVMSGLFLETLRSTSQVDPGFQTEHLLVAGVDLNLQGYGEEEARSFSSLLIERIEALPGVEAAGLSASVPLGGSSDTWGLRIEGVEPPPNRTTTPVAVNWVSRGYFDTLGVPIQRGRGFLRSDEDGSSGAVLVNETLAERYWPDESPIGKTLSAGRLDAPQRFEVIGTVADIRSRHLKNQTRPFAYFVHADSPLSGTVLQIRTRTDPLQVLPSVRVALAEIDPSLPLFDTMAINELVSRSLWQERMLAQLFALFALLALGLGATGVYGVVAYAVSQRSQEIGIRMALGADASNVRAFFLRGSLLLLLVGFAVGVLSAIGLGQLLGGLLHGVRAADPRVIALSALVLSATVLFAAGLPTSRATRIDPVVALRDE